MNARILKKLSKRAVPLLVKMGYSRKNFSLAECHEVPWKSRSSTVLKGTPLLWRQTSYECNEWDAEPAWDALQSWAIWQGVSIDESGSMTGPSKRLYPSDILRMAEAKP